MRPFAFDLVPQRYGLDRSPDQVLAVEIIVRFL